MVQPGGWSTDRVSLIAAMVGDPETFTQHTFKASHVVFLFHQEES
jgi:hypothetical protein